MQNKARKIKIYQITLSIIILISYIILEVLWELSTSIDPIKASFTWIRIGIKIFILLLSFFIFLPTFIRERNSYHLTVVIALIIFGLGDILINNSAIAGGVLFFVGHLFLTTFFFIEHKPKKKNYLVCLITFFIFSSFIIYSMIKQNKVLLGLLSLVYALVVSMNLALSIDESNNVRLPIFIFVISDFILVLNMGLFSNNLILGHILRFFYYSSIVLLALSKRYRLR